MLLVLAGVMFSGWAFGQQTNLPTTEKVLIDRAELFAQNPGASEIHIFVGKTFSVDNCNAHGLQATPAKSYDAQDQTEVIFFMTAGSVQGTLKACLNNINVDKFLSVPVTNFDANSATFGKIEINYPEGYQVKYQVISRSELKDL